VKQKTIKSNRTALIAIAAILISATLNGCGKEGLKGYSNQWLYPQDVSSVYVEMFDQSDFRRGHEYVLTDAICKHIEVDTPYKIVSDRDLADTILSGRVSIGQGVLATERHRGQPLENEVRVRVSVTWKNLKTGEILINNKDVAAPASYSPRMGQSFDYASKVAINKAAEKVVELMQESW